jgi:S-adenosylmethionine uptake transporter
MQKRRLNGIAFLVFSIVLGCIGDTISKFLGSGLPAVEIVFFRFFIGIISLLPFLKGNFKGIVFSHHVLMNIIRGILGVLSIYLCTYSVINMPLVEVTVLLWSIPLFEILLCKIFFNEKIGKLRIFSTIFGFITIAVSSLFSNTIAFSTNKIMYLIPLLASLFFAFQDVIIKKIVISDGNNIAMLFYFSIVASICSILPTMIYWITPSWYELFLLSIIGVLGNLMQYCLFTAFKYSDLSFLAPIRYVEVIIQLAFGILFFEEIPNLATIICALILIPNTLYVMQYSQNSNNSKA